MKTSIIAQNKIKRKWYLIDASGQILGRLAAQISTLLRGKHKPYWSPHQDLGDYVVVINASKIRVTGKKLKNKYYFRHSGYLGGLKKESLEEKLKKDPCSVVCLAVWGMIPHNRLGRKIIKRLKIYKDEKHNLPKEKLEEYKIK